MKFKLFLAATGLALSLGGLQACTKKDDTVNKVIENTENTVPAKDKTRSEAELRRIEERDKLRQKAAEKNKENFGFLRYRTDLSNSSPLACLVFSAPLNSEIDYSPFVEVSPKKSLTYSANGQELCVGGLTFADSRTLTLKEGLKALDGRELKADEKVAIDFSDRPPYVGFKGGGVILPRLDADGLPVETVNVEKLKVEVLRVTDRAIVFKQITEGITRAQGGYGYMYGDDNPNDVSVPVWSGEMDVTSVQNTPVVTVFPLNEAIGTLEPGAYFVKITDARENLGNLGPPAQAQRWIISTDLALTSYQGETGLDVVVRSLQTAGQVSDVKLQLLAQNNEVLGSATSDGTRAARFDAPLMKGEGNLRPRMVVAYGPQGDFAVLDLDRAPIDLSSENISGRNAPYPIDGYVYTERGIYRPGEVIHVSAMLRDEAARAVTDRAGRFVVYRPNGMEAGRQAFTETKLGGVLFDYELPKAAARGQWRVDVEVDGVGRVGSATVSVEDFVPQRIKVDMSTDTETPLLKGETRDVEVESRFLYGAPGAGLTVQSESRMEIDASPFEDFKGYRFGPYDQTFRQEIIEFPNTVTDGAGKVTLPLKPGNKGVRASQPLRLRTVVSVLEPGGRAVSDSVIIPYRPQERYLGVKPKFDYAPGKNESFAFNIASITPAGAAEAAKVDWSLIQVYYNYDWYKDGSRWRWRRSRYVKEVNAGELTLKAGKAGELKFDGLEDYGDYRLIVKDSARKQETSYQFWLGWGGRASDGVEAPDRVRLSVADKAPRQGGKAKITMLPPYAGKAQIVVATDRVLSVTYQDVTEKGTELSIPVTPDWGEGAYVMVSVYSRRDAIANPVPRRAVGVSYVPVDTSDRVFEVDFDVPEIVRPRSEQTIKVTLKDGPKEPVFLTLAAVDEGILALTNFKTPDPASWYFGKKALGVDLYDDYGRLLDPNLGAPANIRSGGDQIGGEGLSVVPTKTVALFSGLVDVGRNGKAEVTFQMPDFNGELRLMAVAWSANGVGAGDQALTVRDEVPVELSLPRFLAPGDKAVATASIDNVELKAGDFTGQLTAKGVVSFETEKLEANLKKGQRADLPVSLTANNEGISDLTISVKGPQDYAVAHSYPIQTRSAFLPESRISKSLIDVGKTYRVEDSLLAGYLPGSSEVTVSFSTLPIDPASLYASLARYPYGCTEQMTSRAMPLLYSQQLAALSGKSDEAADVVAKQKVQDTINTLLNRQSPDGAIGLWREGDRNASPWLGAYATDFLFRAKAAGYVVPTEALERAMSALANISQGDAWRVYGYDTDVWESRWHSDTSERLMNRSAPYALYVMAKAGKADVSRVRYMHDRELRKIESPLARAHLGAALAILGDKSRATEAFEAAIDGLGYKNSGDYYQTPLRDLAGILALAAETEMVAFLNDLSEKLGADTPDANRLTTQEKAFLLLASNALNDGENLPKIETDTASKGGDNRFAFDADDAAKSASFVNRSAGPVWQTTFVRGAPVEPPSSSASNMRLTKAYYTMQGSKPDLQNLVQGDRIVIQLTLTPEERRTNPMIVEDLLPAGFEIEAILRPSDGQSGKGAFSWLGNIASPNIAESRDDRFVAAIDVREKAVSLAYVVRAVTPGNFVLPGAVTEDMYRPQVFARTPSGSVVIKREDG